MNIVEIIFSPTGGTEKVAHMLGSYWRENTVNIDLSDAKTDFSQCVINEDYRKRCKMRPCLCVWKPGI